MQRRVQFAQIAADSHLCALPCLVLDSTTPNRPERVHAPNALSSDVMQIPFFSQRINKPALDRYTTSIAARPARLPACRCYFAGPFFLYAANPHSAATRRRQGMVTVGQVARRSFSVASSSECGCSILVPPGAFQVRLFAIAPGPGVLFRLLPRTRALAMAFPHLIRAWRLVLPSRVCCRQVWQLGLVCRFG